MTKTLSRRAFLARSAIIGCSAAASPLLTPVTFASAPWDTRFVVIILRGGMDGLDVVQPYGDPNYAGLRKSLNGGPGSGAVDLDGFYALHPKLKPLMPLWRAGELGFVQAVSTPYRHKRSHFDGQDLLEAGTAALGDSRDGWLNRMLQNLPGVEQKTAYALGAGEMKVLQGSAPVADWSPDADLLMSPQAVRLAGLLMQDDPLFRDALDEALILSGQEPQMIMSAMEEDTGMMAGGSMQMQVPRGTGNKSYLKIAEFAAEQLRAEARVASFSLNGWDSHNRQSKTIGDALGRLSDTILALKSGVGDQIWGKTAVVAMTEFGRTVRENGTGGTDHGTGGAMLLAGGAVHGGKVHGTWPGLSEADLFERRDLMPTGDVRAAAGWIMHGLTGIDRSLIEANVFPGVDLGRNPGLLL
ncbi:DUF1501 domain-containing protein [Falsiphaeobacter marinintestinus]|uniref:DUF1501 domain-containing protein n=1 Tax=Falsiphaeobacter marinintestinus TaxID=1492905 RepID=UPI0011B61E24|nr:DUF1501 domain-containing protein [Phaeobacter marinintestinus]